MHRIDSRSILKPEGLRERQKRIQIDKIKSDQQQRLEAIRNQNKENAARKKSNQMTLISSGLEITHSLFDKKVTDNLKFGINQVKQDSSRVSLLYQRAQMFRTRKLALKLLSSLDHFRRIKQWE